MSVIDIDSVYIYIFILCILSVFNNPSSPVGWSKYHNTNNSNTDNWAQLYCWHRHGDNYVPAHKNLLGLVNMVPVLLSMSYIFSFLNWYDTHPHLMNGTAKNDEFIDWLGCFVFIQNILAFRFSASIFEIVTAAVGRSCGCSVDIFHFPIRSQASVVDSREVTSGHWCKLWNVLAGSQYCS